MKKVLVLLLIVTALVFTESCTESNSKLNIDVSSVEKPEVSIKRYGKTMFAIPQNIFIDTVMSYANQFPLFFEGSRSDSVALLGLKSFFADPYMQELNIEVQKKYMDLQKVEGELADAMQHFKYYFPNSVDYNYYSYISGLDIAYPIKVADNNIIIGLDLFLGETKVYNLSGFPKYKSIWFKEESIVPSAMSELASGLLPESDLSAKLLHQFIEQGKRLYFVNAMIPTISDTLLLRYTQGQYDWCNKNEARLWSLMIENQFLFKNDKAIQKKFMEDGPFTSILSTSAPARLGHFIGWKIVEEYMANNDVSLISLIEEDDDQKILKKSKYKPKR